MPSEWDSAQTALPSTYHPSEQHTDAEIAITAVRRAERTTVRCIDVESLDKQLLRWRQLLYGDAGIEADRQIEKFDHIKSLPAFNGGYE